MTFAAAILDVDGVLTRTAAQHERAWKLLFDEVLQQRGDTRPFSHEDYLAHVDGKPRMDGLRAFLASRGLALSEDEARALAEQKNRTFLLLLEQEGVEAFEDAVRQVRSWRAQGLGIAFVSASRNAAQVLRAAGLEALCDVRIDGLSAREQGLRGKPDLFREAARRLHVEPPQALVVEDAVAGVEAAAQGGFGLVVGLARDGDPRALLEHGAHRVVQRLDELAGLIPPCAWRAGEHGSRAAWTLRFDDWSPEKERLREALCTLGNGYFATRGAAEESRADRVHYPGTYFAGGYDRITTEVRGELVQSEDLVNWPNWLSLTFRPERGEWLSLERCEILDFCQELDLQRGELIRRVRFKDPEGRETSLSSRRLVSMKDPHVAALRWELTPHNWSGPLELRSSLDGTVRNEGVDRYGALRGQHLIPDGVGHSGQTIWLAVRTRQSRIRVAQAARTTLLGADPEAVRYRVDEHADRVDLMLALEAVQGVPLAVEKVVALHTSRDHAISEALADARERLMHLPGYDALLAAHARSWASLWRRYDIQLGVEQEATHRILRLHIFHLLQVTSPHVVDRDVGVPARGLHGEAYRGHIFWDELFVFPFLNYSLPELTRELLMYRYRRLDAARWHARALGHAGAAYPWQSGSSGREESQRLHLNPRSGRWLPDETHLQRHVSAAIAWNVWQYYQVSGDQEFLLFYGAEMLVEIARCWASMATWDAELERYRLRGLVGPDEFHTRYPGADRPGLDDNAYTNIMAAWCLRCAERALCELGDERRHELMEALGITEEDRSLWRSMASKLRVVFHDGHIISQFDGYAQLRELDWDGYRQRYGDVHRLDRILEAEGDTPNAYKASKQADVLMLFFLFSADELVEQLQSMGYAFEPSWIPENIDYYLRRTSHGSTLSRVVHSWVLARSDRARSFRLFQEALQSDVSDTQRGTTAEGIHLGAMAGTVDLVQRGYTGAVVRDGVLWLEPRLPDEMGELRTRFRFRGAWLDVHVTHEAIEVAYSEGQAPVARVGLNGRVREVARGARCRMARGEHVGGPDSPPS